MAGDFVIVVTLDTHINIYWLELFTFDKDVAVDRVQIYTATIPV